MSTLVLQNFTRINGSEPMVVIIQYDSNNFFLTPNDEQKFTFRRMIVREPKVDRRGIGEKDQNGNILEVDVAHTVVVEDPAGVGMTAWKRCPESLYRALERGTYQHCYRLGRKPKKELLEKQDWYKPGMGVWYMQPFTPEIGVHIGRAEDAMALLEARVAQLAAEKKAAIEASKKGPTA